MRVVPLTAGALAVAAIAAFTANALLVEGGRFGRDVDSLDLATQALARTVVLPGPPNDADAETLMGDGTLWATLGFRAASADELSGARAVRWASLEGDEAEGVLARAGLERLKSGALRTTGRAPELAVRAGELAAVERTAFDAGRWTTTVLASDARTALGAIAEHAPATRPGVVLHLVSGARAERRGRDWVRIDPPATLDGEPRTPSAPAAPLGAGVGVRIGGDVDEVRRVLGTAESAVLFARLTDLGVSVVALDVRISWLRPGEGPGELSVADLSVVPGSATLEGDERVARAVEQAHALGLRVVLWPTPVASPGGPPLEALEGRARKAAVADLLDLGRAAFELAARVGADAVVGLEGRLLPTSTAELENQSDPEGAAAMLEARALLRAELAAVARESGVPAVAVARHDASLRIAADDDALGDAFLLAGRLHPRMSADGRTLAPPFVAQLERCRAAGGDRLSFVAVPVTEPGGLAALRPLRERGDTLLLLERWVAGGRGGAFDLSEASADDWSPLMRDD
ncbi:MAG: hypothetical protein AAFR54_01595 [Planctomycetota bacterium]